MLRWIPDASSCVPFMLSNTSIKNLSEGGDCVVVIVAGDFFVQLGGPLLAVCLSVIWSNRKSQSSGQVR